MSELDQNSDEALYARCRDQEEALASLIERHWNRTFRLALSVVRDAHAAEDAAQLAFIKVVEHARAGHAVDRFGPFLRSCVVNEARMHVRGSRRRSSHEERAARAKPETRETVAALAEVTEALPDELRLPLELHYALGYTHAEVAEALDVPTGSVASRIQKALGRLRTQLAGVGLVLAVGALEVLLADVAEARGATAPAPTPAQLTAPSNARPAGRSRVVALLAAALVTMALLVTVSVLLLRGGERPAVAQKPPEPPPPAPVARPVATEPEGVRTVGRVVDVRGGRALVSVGADDKVAVGDRFEIWRGTVAIAAGDVVQALSDSSWVQLAPPPEGAPPVQAGDLAYGVAPRAKRVALAELEDSPVAALVKALEASPLPPGSSRRTISSGAIESAELRRAIDEAIAASKKIALTKDADVTIDAQVIEHQPEGSRATVVALVLRARIAPDRTIATAIGRSVHVDGATVPRARWAEHFAHAFGPADHDALVAALHARIAGTKLGPVFRLESRNLGLLEAQVESLLESLGSHRDTSAEGRPDLTLELRVVRAASSEGGTPGIHFTGEVVATTGGRPLTTAETRTWKPDARD